MSVTQINSQKIKDGTVDTADLKDGSVTLAKMAALTTKGDLLTRTSTTHVRLPVGTDGQILAADSSAAAGVSWQPRLQGQNLVINGGMQVFQRGVTITSLPLGGFCASRWAWRASTTAVITGSRSTDVPALVGAEFSMNLEVTTAHASPTHGGWQYRWEARDFAHWHGQTVTLSFWAKSNLTGPFSVNIRNADATRTWIGNYTINAADTWQYVTFTLTHDTTGTWNTVGALLVGASLYFAVAAEVAQQGAAGWQNGDFKAGASQTNVLATAGNYFRLALVQLELGAFASPFERVKFTETLMLCGRYYQSSFPAFQVPAQNSGVNSPYQYFSPTTGAVQSGFPVIYAPEMRNTPTVTFYNPFAANNKWRNYTLNADSGTAANFGGTVLGLMIQNPQVVGDGVGHGMMIHWTADAEI